MMRIALYYNIPSGGAKRTIYETTKRLAERHEIDVFTFSTAEHDFSDIRPFVNNYYWFDFTPHKLLNFPFGRLNNVIRLYDLFQMYQHSRSIARIIESRSYDIFFAHPCMVTQGPVLLQQVNNLPSIYYCQEPPRAIHEERPARPYYKNDGSRWQATLNSIDPFLKLHNIVLQEVDRKNTRSADKVLVSSNFVRKIVNKIYKLEASLSHLGVDVQWFKVINAEKKNIILSVGSLTPLKGFDFLIKSVALIPKGLRPPLVIASNFQMPAEKVFLEEMAERFGVSLVLLNHVSDDELISLFNSALMTVYSPIQEPFGLVALEAMACGSPVVAVREGGIQETVLHQRTGLLVDRDPAQFAQAVQSLISNPRRAQEYGKNGREHVVKNWSWDKSVERLERHLQSII
jgi:glycosyltransferase involved in cell wall biosynthesis